MRQRLALLLSIALLLAAIGELVAHRWLVSRALEANDYQRLREPVAAARNAHEPIEVRPAYLQPYVRQTLGDSLMPAKLLARSDDASVTSVLTIALDGRKPSARPDWRVESLAAVGRFQLYRQHSPDPRPLTTDFVAALGPASVAVEMAGKACGYTHTGVLSSGGLGGPPTFPKSRFQCPGGPFYFVGRTTIADQNFKPRRCLWAHPPRDGALVIRFEDVALGSELIGHSGMYWITERERRGAPVQLKVVIDGQDFATVIHADGDGWTRFSLPLGAHAKKAHARVEWQVSSPDNRHRHFCFEARSL